MESKFDSENKSYQGSVKELRVIETLLLRICEGKVFCYSYSTNVCQIDILLLYQIHFCESFC